MYMLSDNEIDTFRRAQILSSLIVRAFLCLISHDTADKLLKVTINTNDPINMDIYTVVVCH